MIILNSNKELIRVEHWSDIESRPGFSKDLDPKEHQLAAIIGRYAFSDQIRCGLSNCHTPHAKGYIVSTKDGRETNIGKDCGKRYFGVDFETLSRQFDQDIADKENREKLWSFSFRLEEVKQQIHALRTRDRGADRVHRNSRCVLENGRAIPASVVRHIANMLKTRQTLFTVGRQATEREIEELEAARGQKLPRPYYAEEPVAEIDGMEALYQENDVRKLLVLELQEIIRVFEALSIDHISSGQLRQWSKWIGGHETIFERAVNSTDSGNRLLRAANLRPFVKLITEKDDRKAFEQFLTSLGQ